jgi:hypothetical protein
MTRLEKQMEFINSICYEMDLIHDCVEEEDFKDIESIITEVRKAVKDCKRLHYEKVSQEKEDWNL